MAKVEYISIYASRDCGKPGETSIKITCGPRQDSEQLPLESKSRALILDHKFILVITLYCGDEE
jgi:hypothetical protein